METQENRDREDFLGRKGPQGPLVYVPEGPKERLVSEDHSALPDPRVVPSWGKVEVLGLEGTVVLLDKLLFFFKNYYCTRSYLGYVYSE